MYALSYSSRAQVIKLLYGPFSMPSLIVAYLFPCKGITHQFLVALLCKINISNRKNLTKREKCIIFPVSIAHMDLEKLNI